ncbi:MAG: mannitol dehydrogenase family protein [Actinomycetota bacterium]
MSDERPHVDQPGYDPSAVTPGIVHFGVGNFHRAHQALYIDKLLGAGLAQDWSICGVGVLPGDVAMRDALRDGGMRYTLVERYPDGRAPARSVASITEYLFAPDSPEAVLEKLADPSVRIVSLTITEGGYNIDDETGRFLAHTPAIQADLVPGAVPSTVFGMVVEGLRRRRDRGIPPFTVMSCDNLPGNGTVARGSFTAFAELRDPELAAWITAEVSFPNCMVDRITPVTTDEVREWITETYGTRDPWPVASEGFTQWVLEDDFPLGRPPYEQVGVQLVADVTPYEHLKLRLLNASHQAMAYFGYLMGYRYAHEASTDPLIARLLTSWMRDEAAPTLEPVPGVDVEDYERSLMERFANPYVRDTLLRLATDGSDRIAKFVLPVVQDRLAAGGSVELAAAIVASWAVFARGLDEEGDSIPFIDRQADAVASAVARQSDDDPAGFLRDPRIFGDLAHDPIFAEAFTRIYRDILSRGSRAALETLVDAPSRRK